MYFSSLAAVCVVLAARFVAPVTSTNTTSCDPLTASPLPQIFILTDISNEPDDQESLVRCLVHSDLYNITGIAAVTSYWLNTTNYPDVVKGVISNYSSIRDRLQFQTTGYFPSADYLKSVTHSGSTSYGLAALEEPLSDASVHLISVVDSSVRPIYIQAWGGTNVLASALNHISLTRSQVDISTFTSKLRVYTISDQDNTGFWIRARFPSIQYISSQHAWNYYGDATWPGISGELYYSFDLGGPDTSLVTDDWLRQHIQIGPFGSTSYPTPAYIMEGDSPSLLFTMQNGLNSPEHPEWGSWGGRYRPDDLSRVSGNHFGDTFDYARGVNNATFVSNKAAIWRWRSAYQSEFAARMQWTLPASSTNISSYSSVPIIQHPPVVVVNETCGFQPLTLAVSPSENVTLDASASFSVDVDMPLTFSWMHYREVTLTQGNIIEVPELNISCATAECTQVLVALPNVTTACATATYSLSDVEVVCQTYHVILAVRNAVTLGMTRYKRVILQVQAPANLTTLSL